MQQRCQPAPDRRQWLRGAAAATTVAASVGTVRGADEEGKAIVKGNIKQSVASWCFTGTGDKWSLDKLCQITKALGVRSVELLGPDSFATLKKHGLVCAMTSNTMPGASYMYGYNNPRYRDELVTRTKKVIEACAAAGFPSVIGFIGYKWARAEDPKSGVISRDEAARNCLVGLKQVAGHAEKHGVTLCIEHLNTRDDSHPMKGHPGYQGDDLDWMAEILRQVGSPRVKFLFDIYHVQIMHGDVIRRLEQNKDLLGHIHTAGNPGRGELDDTQEINYPPIMRKLLQLKYDGYVGQEFIPTRDARAGLRQALRLCDV